MAIIYKATFKNGKSYIGYTSKSLNFRIKTHKTAAYSANSQYIFHKAIRKYGFDNIEWTIIEQSDNETYLLHEAENKNIVLYKTHITENGYNSTWGGDSGTNKIWFDGLDDIEKKLYLEICRNNIKKTHKSEKRFIALKKSWKNNDERRKNTSIRSKNIWKDESKKNSMKNKLSVIRKNDWENGLYSRDQLIIMTEKAKEVVKGSRWYNDGIKNYRLKEYDEKIIILNLKLGKI